MKILINKDLNQVNVLDERFYHVGDKYYPSVTTVLDSYPKGFAYKDWLKSNGYNSDVLLRRAAERGTNVHNAIEDFLNGKELNWIINGKEQYTFEEWQMINRYMDFHKDYIAPYKGQVAAETQLFSHTLKLGGTADLVCKIDGETWMIDFKTSNAMYKTYEMQLAVYKEMWDEANSPKIDRYGVLWLNAKTRTKKQFQGIGWQIKEYTQNHEHNMSLYRHTRALWDEENPNYKPKNLILPNTFKISA